MRICTFEVATAAGRVRRLGAVIAEGIVDLNAACARQLARTGEPQPRKLANVLVPPEATDFLDGEGRALNCAASALQAFHDEIHQAKAEPVGLDGETIVYSPTDVRLLAPVPHPRSLRDFFGFEQHVKTGFARRGEPMPKEWYEIPVYYKSGHHNILGPEEDVRWPGFTERFDYELELAAVIGRKGSNIPAAKALDYIAGLTVMNDFSARDIQRREMAVRLGPAKGKDWATALGPWMVTLDEIGDPYKLRMMARVNGELWSEGNSGDLFWKFEQMIEFLSRDDTIYPGDVIGSGTVGTGCGLELDRWVEPGDVMELEIERIGVLRNRVVRP